jgi:hypothetical protein
MRLRVIVVGIILYLILQGGITGWVTFDPCKYCTGNNCSQSTIIYIPIFTLDCSVYLPIIMKE